MAVRNTHNTKHDPDDRVWLIAIAAPRELDAAIGAFGLIGDRPKLWECVGTDSGVDLVWTGVGKANAAGAAGRVLDPSRHRGVLSIGIAGSLAGSGCTIGDVVCASASVFGDEGVATPDGFSSCAQMGFSPFDDGSDAIEHNPGVVDWLGSYADHIGPIACVSSCSGTDEGASAVVDRTGAIAEAMEGAAACVSAHRIDKRLLTGELRVISNTAGDREKQQWDLDGSLEKLGRVLGRIANDLR